MREGVLGTNRPAVVAPPAPATAFEETKTNTTVWWAWSGVAFLVLQLVVLGQWAADATRTPTAGPDAVPGHAKVTAVVLQVLGPVGAVAVIVYAVVQCRRQKRITFDTLLIAAWFTCCWQEPIVNFFRTQFFYNSYFTNFGSWGPKIPGWLSPNAELLPSPLLFTGLMAASSGLAMAINITMVLRFVARRRPGISKVKLVFVALAAAAVLDLILELVFIRTELYSWAGAVRWLSIPPGSRFQFPVHEALMFAPVWATTGLLRYFQDDRGRSAVDRGADRLRISARRRSFVRLLAFVGVLNAVNLGYNLTYAATALYGGPTPDLPSYLRNGMCGEGTQYECPAPGEPIPVKGGEPTRRGG
jgi:hypothetical protein